MNYDRLAAGERLRSKRILLGMTQEEIAETETENTLAHTDEVAAIMSLLDTYPAKSRSYALNLLRLFLVACRNE